METLRSQSPKALNAFAHCTTPGHLYSVDASKDGTKTTYEVEADKAEGWDVDSVNMIG